MKFTLGWLKDHLDTTASLDDISKTLTAIGLEVESITDRATALAPFTVGKILHAEKHPEADKLRVCKVLSNNGELQIVCGAPNAREGIHVALAQEGAVIPANGMVIKKSKIRNVESNGMLCSADELAIGGDSAGIIELPLTTQVGQSVAEVLGLNDPVIEIAITPNRADCLSVHGVARDLAAAGLGTLKPLPAYLNEVDCASFWQSAAFGHYECPVAFEIEKDAADCDQFCGYFIRGAQNVVSPDWLRRRLEAVGQKSISAVVDITNYLMLDLGRPMHAYDADKISSGSITVRRAKSGESFRALNGKDYILQESMLVIADAQGAVGLAGIIGGERTACSAETKNIFLEVAHFDPVSIASTARKLDILSDARYRFERGVDKHTQVKVKTAAAHKGFDVASTASYLIHMLCGGDVSKEIHGGTVGYTTPVITLRPEAIAKLGGVEIAFPRAKQILESLGFWLTQSAGAWHVTRPSWRADVEGEADLVEEILRIHGYDKIPATPLPKLPNISKPALNAAQKRVHLAKRALAGRGMLELCTWSFLPEAQAKAFGGGNPKLKLLNPINAELDMMRPSLLPNLLEAVKKNAFRGFKTNNLFEVGLQFTDITPEGQRMVATAIRSGFAIDQAYKNGLFTQTTRAVDAFDAKADALALLGALGLGKCDITAQAPAWYHPGRSGALTLGGKIILGYFGEIHPGLLVGFDLESPVVGFELFLDAIPLPRAKSKAKPALKTSDFQAVERDFAFVVDAAVLASDISKSLSGADKQLITSVEIFDVYAGKGLDEGKKSVAVKVTLQASDRTLSEADISAASAAIVASAAKGFGGMLRQ